jgi:uncharacterized membrane protein (GlpM family)
MTIKARDSGPGRNLAGPAKPISRLRAFSFCSPEGVMDLLLRFLVGGAVVSLFAMIGDTLRPKSFAGLFAAAPSIALATISLTVVKQGAVYAAIESRSMIFGAAAFFIYASLMSRALFRERYPVLLTSAAGLVAWVALAMGIKILM